MNRITVIAVTVISTLAVTAAAGLSVFSVRQAGDDGVMLLYGRQKVECDEGGGCAVWSQREFKTALLMFIAQMQPSKGRGLES